MADTRPPEPRKTGLLGLGKAAWIWICIAVFLAVVVALFQFGDVSMTKM